MDAVDVQAAEAFQTVRARLVIGPWNTGELGEKGYVVSEPLNASIDTVSDGISRYTDRYLSKKTIGRTVQDFAFDPQFLPLELHRAAGLSSGSSQSGKQDKDTNADRLSRLERLTAAGLDEAEGPEKKEEDEDKERDKDEDAEAEVVEDEFEELDDDDYNAEKYFDDGEDFGEDDNGDDEAAY